MTITKDEKVFRRWEYASVRRKREKTNYSLTVTNKRIVSETKNSSLTLREEIPIDSVKSIAVRRQVKSIKKLLKTIGIIFCVFGIISLVSAIIDLIASIVFLASEGSFSVLLENLGTTLLTTLYPFFPAVISFAISALFKFIASKVKDKVSFFLVLTTYGAEGTSMQVGMTSIFSRLFNRRLKGKLKVRVSDSVTEEILETIGALIVDNR